MASNDKASSNSTTDLGHPFFTTSMRAFSHLDLRLTRCATCRRSQATQLFEGSCKNEIPQQQSERMELASFKQSISFSEIFEMNLKNGASTELTSIHTPDLYKERSNNSIIRRENIFKNECNW